MSFKDESDVTFKEFPKQKEFWEAITGGQYKFVMFGGAIRGGKTVITLASLIALCKLYDGAKYIIVRKSLQRIKDTVLPTFYSIRPDNFTVQDPSQGNSWEWKSTNGSMIKFYAENIEKDPDLKRFRGLEADGFVFEEMDISEKCFFVGFERTGTWKMKERMDAKSKGLPVPPSLIVGTSNPQGGWVKKLIYDKHIRGVLNKNWHYIQSRVYDNPSVSAEWIQSQRENLTPDRFNLMIEGDWTATDNQKPFFYYFDESKHKTDNLIIDNDIEITLGWDFNFSPVTCIVAQKINGIGCFFYKAYLQEEGGTESLCKENLGWLRGRKDLRITGDNNGWSNKTTATSITITDFAVIEDYFGVKVSPVTRLANASHRHSREVCNHLLKTVPCFFDGDECLGLIQEIKDAETTDRGGLNKSGDKDSHLVDAFRYIVNEWFAGVDDINDFRKQITSLQERNQELREQYQSELDKRAQRSPMRFKVNKNNNENV